MAHSQRGQLPLTKLSEDLAFASWSVWCKHEDSDQPIAPAWTDGKTIFYGTDFEKFTFDEKIGVAAHEIMHVAFRHPARGLALRSRLGPDYRHKTFNIAIDGIVNETLRCAGYKLPSSAIYLTTLLEKFLNIKATAADCLSEWDSEKLYMALTRTKLNEEEKKKHEKKKKDQKQEKSDDKSDQSDEGDQGQDEGEDQEGGNTPSDQEGDGDAKGNGKGKGKPQQGKGKSGGGDEYDPTVADALEQWADENGYKGDLDEEAMADAAGNSAEEALEEAEWSQRVQRGMSQAQMGGKMAGNGIGQLGFKLADIPESRTPWERVLRSLVTKAVTRRKRPSYARPTKRFLAMDSEAMRTFAHRPVYEQGWINSQGVPRIAVGVDVSGSIDNQVLRRFAGEIASIGKKTGAEIHVLVFDTQVLSQTKMEGMDWDTEITNVEFARGGGTDFKDVIDKAALLDPSCIIILTDLYASFGEDPKCKVIWAIEEEKPPVTPPFGTVLSMAR